MWKDSKRYNKQLLIVPYGIETCHKQKCSAVRYVLLIVPYGIETAANHPEALHFTDF